MRRQAPFSRQDGGYPGDHKTATPDTATPTGRPRADAARNRERLLEAAKAVLGAGGPNASLDAVARAAGVGPGTLYRHFPTREALSEAVYRREVEHLVELPAQMANTSGPVVALRTWLAANVEFVATKRAWQRH